MVVVLSQDRCMPCKMTAKKMTQLGIEHTYLDVSEAPDLVKIAQDAGAMSTPLVFRGREFLWSGYRPDDIKALAV